MKWALTTFRFIVIVVELVVIGGFLFRFWLDVRISDLDDEIKQKSALISSRSSFEQDFREKQLKLNMIDFITSDEHKALPLFDLVNEGIPADTQLLEFSKEKSQIIVRAATVNETSIAAFLQYLVNSEEVSNPVLTRVESNADSPFVEFFIEADISDLSS